MAEIFRLYPEISLPQDLHQLPHKGIVHIDDHAWTFRPHGLGLKFESTQEGRVIDMHECLPRSDVIDAWRLLQYLESSGAGELEFEAVCDALASSAKRKRLRALGNHTYELVHQPSR